MELEYGTKSKDTSSVRNLAVFDYFVARQDLSTGFDLTLGSPWFNPGWKNREPLTDC